MEETYTNMRELKISSKQGIYMMEDLEVKDSYIQISEPKSNFKGPKYSSMIFM